MKNEKNMQKQGGCLFINGLNKEQAIAAFMQCNTSENWCKKMAQSRPFADMDSLIKTTDKHWQASTEADFLQAFDGHPEIGDVSTLREKYKNTAASAGHEQSGVNSATEETLRALAKGNKDYKDKFGFIFIVCASGKTADEMLALLEARLPNTREQELANGAEEQRKITHLRLEKLCKDNT